MERFWFWSNCYQTRCSYKMRFCASVWEEVCFRSKSDYDSVTDGAKWYPAWVCMNTFLGWCWWRASWFLLMVFLRQKRFGNTDLGCFVILCHPQIRLKSWQRKSRRQRQRFKELHSSAFLPNSSTVIIMHIPPESTCLFTSMWFYTATWLFMALQCEILHFFRHRHLLH